MTHLRTGDPIGDPIGDWFKQSKMVRFKPVPNRYKIGDLNLSPIDRRPPIDRCRQCIERR